MFVGGITFCIRKNKGYVKEVSHISEKERFIVKKVIMVVVEVGMWFGLSSGAPKVGGLRNIKWMRVSYGRVRGRRRVGFGRFGV